MSTVDQQFIEFIVKSLVGKPDAVEVARTIDEKGVLLELTVDPEDLGRVIGKRGATAQSLRTLLRALGTKNDARYNLKIIDNGERPPAYSSQPVDASASSDEPASDDAGLADDGTNAPADDTPSIPVNDTNDGEEIPELPAREDHDSMVSKTRKELEDLDDLEL